MEPIIEFDDVSAVRGKQTVWSNATFAVPTGAFSAVIGPNGAGKSTLIQLILGHLQPGRGGVTVFGRKPESGNPKIGVVPQNHTLTQAESISCRDLVGLGLLGTKFGSRIRDRRIASDIDKALESVDALGIGHKRFGEISGGQQQRVTIAQAMITKPKLLLLDEPLAGLDLQGQVEIIELVHRINHNEDVTVLFVTHDLNPLLAHIDSVLYLMDRTVKFGAADNVVTQELLSEMYGTPVQVLRTDDGCIYTRTE